jgi:hypothetical protein
MPAPPTSDIHQVRINPAPCKNTDENSTLKIPA